VVLEMACALPPVDLTLDEAVALMRNQGIAGLQAASVLARR
jgi:hypothetical protein